MDRVPASGLVMQIQGQTGMVAPDTHLETIEHPLKPQPLTKQTPITKLRLVTKRRRRMGINSMAIQYDRGRTLRANLLFLQLCITPRATPKLHSLLESGATVETICTTSTNNRDTAPG